MKDLSEIQHIIRKTLKKVDSRIEDESDHLWSLSAETLLLFTGMVESDYNQVIQGRTLRGTGRGFWQVESDTAYDNIQNYIMYGHDLEDAILYACELKILPLDRTRLSWILTTNIAFGVCMARLWYFRATPEPIPENMNDMAEYWNSEYNCNNEHGTNQDFITAARECINLLNN